MHDSVRAGHDVSLHELVAQGDDSNVRVRRLAAGLSVCSLLALVVVEAAAVGMFLDPLIGDRVPKAALVVLLVAIAALPTSVAGGNGVLQSSQLFLGTAYFAVSGATVALLYLHLSTLTPLSPPGTLALVVAASVSAIALFARRSRYVDNPVHSAAAGVARHGPRWVAVRLLGRAAKVLNASISTLLVLIVVVVSMELYGAHARQLLDGLVSAFGNPTRLPLAGVAALCTMLLCQPLADVTRWQTLAASRAGGVPELDRDRGAREFRIEPFETAAAWLWMPALGAIGFLAMQPSGTSDMVRLIVLRMAAAGDAVTGTALGLLVVAIFALAASTMSAQLSALLTTLRHDLVPASGASASSNVAGGARRRSWQPRVGIWGVALAAALAVCLVELAAALRSDAEHVLAWLVAAGAPQLALLPLVADAIVQRTRGRPIRATPRWALAILGAGAVAAATFIGAYFVTGSDIWLWSSAPASLASAGLLWLGARVASHRSRDARRERPGSGRPEL
jgi:hypothetical protein